MIRTFSKSDAARCCEIINLNVEHMNGLNQAARSYLSRKNKPEVLAQELAQGHSIVFEEDGNILGLGSLDRDEIKRVYVHPAASNRGIGSSILESLEQEAVSQGNEFVVLKASPSAVSFYSSMGYQAQEEETHARGKARFCYIRMKKRLAPFPRADETTG